VATTGLSFMAGRMLDVAFALSRANPGVPVSRDELAFLQMIAFVLGISVVLAYYIISEGLFQRTLGKLLTGTRVVTADGGRPTFGQIVGRSFARMIPFEAFSFLGGDGGPVGWHDSLSGTRVVSVR
jgi:uncharacterized RDD family membrane protein YckC